jgi:hypothetical protein
MTQQKLIEDLLDNELANHPELETLSKSGIEQLFVKNLENVQGMNEISLFSQLLTQRSGWSIINEFWCA